VLFKGQCVLKLLAWQQQTLIRLFRVSAREMAAFGKAREVGRLLHSICSFKSFHCAFAGERSPPVQIS
jgi:hypothetical protein